MFNFIGKLFASVGVVIASVFGFGGEPVETPVATLTPTPVLEESAQPTPKVVYVTVTPTPEPTTKVVFTSMPTPTPVPTYTPTKTPIYISTPTPTPTVIPVNNYKGETLEIINQSISKLQILLGAVRDDVYSMRSILDALSSTSEPIFVTFRDLTTLRLQRVSQTESLLVDLIENNRDIKESISKQVYITDYRVVRELEDDSSNFDLIFRAYINDAQDYNNTLSSITSLSTSSNSTSPNIPTIWRMDSSPSGMGGTITGSGGQIYRWDCIDWSSCTMY